VNKMQQLALTNAVSDTIVKISQCDADETQLKAKLKQVRLKRIELTVIKLKLERS